MRTNGVYGPYIHMNTNIFKYIHTYIHKYIYSHVHKYIQIATNIYTHVHKYTQIYTHVQNIYLEDGSQDAVNPT